MWWTIIAKSVYLWGLMKLLNIVNLWFSMCESWVNNYNLLSNEIIEQIVDISDSEIILKKVLKKHNDLEAFYLIDVDSSKQIHDTVIDNKNERFIPSKNGDEHYLKEYFYITLESKQGIFLSPNYVSYASGNICKTFAKRFELKNKSYIICIDIVIKEN